MAFLRTVEIGSSPTICYDCWGSSQRIDNKTMRYVFEFNALFRPNNTASFLGIGYGLDASVIIKSGSKTTESAKINIKNSRTEQWGPNQAGGQVLKNFRITVDVESTKANEAAQAFLNITDNSHYFDDNESIGSAEIGTLYSAALFYTNVTNPTSIRVAGLKDGIAAPGQTLTFQWSGAQPGVDNEIVGYSFGCTTNAEPPSRKNPNLIEEPDITDASITWTTPSERGNTYYFFIKTRGKIDGYNAEWQQLSETCLVNKRPGIPQVEPSRTKVPKDGGVVQFSATPGTDENTNQTLSVLYRTDESKDWQSLSGSVQVTQETTFYFTTFDGLETSDDGTDATKVTVTITVNSPPAIESVKYQKDDDFNKTHCGMTVAITAEDTDSSSLTYYYYLYMGDKQIYSYESKDPTYTVSDIRSLLSEPWTDATKFSWKGMISDGLDSTAVRAAAKDFQLTPLPTFETIFNQHEFFNIANSNNLHFSDNMRVSLSISEGAQIDKLYSQVQININQRSLTNDLSSSNNLGYADFSGLKSITNPGAGYKIDIFVIDSGGNKWTVGSTERTRVPEFNLTTVNHGFTRFQPFMLDPKATLLVVSINNNGCVDTTTLKDKFSIPLNGINYNWTIGGKSGTTQAASPTLPSQENGVSESIIIYQSAPDLFKSLPSSNNLDWTRDYVGNQSQITVTITNAFNDSVSRTINCPTYFAIAATEVNAPALRIGANNEYNNSVSYTKANHFLQENTYLFGEASNVIIKDYFGCKNAVLEINRSNNPGWQTLKSLTTSAIKSEGTAYQFNAPIEFKLAASMLYQIGAIASDKNYTCQFRLVFTNNAGKISYFNFINDVSNQYDVFTHRPATATISNAIYDADKKKIQCKLDVVYGWGQDDDELSKRTSTYQPILPNTSITAEPFKSSDLSFDYEFGGTDTWINFNVKFTTTQTLELSNKPSITSTKTIDSNSLVVYNVTPTVSYRANYLGINTKAFNDTDLLSINGINARNMICLNGSGAQHSVTLNLADGNIVGITIDCGAWE